jgi:hypothetical protein
MILVLKNVRRKRLKTAANPKRVLLTLFCKKLNLILFLKHGTNVDTHTRTNTYPMNIRTHTILLRAYLKD